MKNRLDFFKFTEFFEKQSQTVSLELHSAYGPSRSWITIDNVIDSIRRIGSKDF